jgi:hypothetical protein
VRPESRLKSGATTNEETDRLHEEFPTGAGGSCDRSRRLREGAGGHRHPFLESHPAHDHTFADVAAGANSWGPDQCRNDRDGTVEHDERLRITGITPGSYDVSLVDDTGRKCIVRNVAVAPGAVFSIEERQLTECGN